MKPLRDAIAGWQSVDCASARQSSWIAKTWIFNQRLLTIRQTKFNKSRLIPLHVSTRDVLAEYAQRRDRLIPTQSSPCFLLNDHGRCLESSNVRRTFYVLSRQIGLRGPVDHTGPRLHDFRHRFALKTLIHGIGPAKISKGACPCYLPF